MANYSSLSPTTMNSAPVDTETGIVGNNSLELFINSHPVVVISKTTCPFCIELKTTLNLCGVNYETIELDEDNALKISTTEGQKFLSQKTGSGTVPHLFVDGNSIGGCNGLKTLIFHGDAFEKLGPYMSDSVVKSNPIGSMGLFYFPETVNNIVVRLNGFFTFSIALLCVIFYTNKTTPWVMLFLAIDFSSRLMYGATVSPLGTGAMLLALPFKPVYACGPPKQFASFCGLFFSGTAAGLWLGGYPIGGAVVSAVLAGAALLEWAFNFCAGCFIFGYAVRFKVVPKSVYHAYLNMLDYRRFTFDFNNPSLASSVRLPIPERERIALSGQKEESPVDLIVKKRVESTYKAQDVDILRHARVDLFAIPMTLVTLGFCYQLTANGFESRSNPGKFIGQWDTINAFYVLTVAALVLYILIAILYIAHFLVFPQKVFKEWANPIAGNFFSTITISAIVFGINYMYLNPVGGVTIVWIGSVVHMLLTVVRMSDLVYSRLAEEYLNPSLMIVPVGNFISAIGFSQYAVQYRGPTLDGQMNYLFIARLWFGVAALFAVVLFTVTFRKAVTDHHSDQRLRFLLWIWLATSSVTGPAYLAVSGYTSEVGRSVFYQSLFCISVFFAAILFMGWIRNFFSYVQDLSIWVMAFSSCALALNAIQYHFYVQDKFSLVVAYFAYAIASTFVTVCLLHTLIWFFDGSLFKPKPKFGPVQFMKFTHECFRAVIPKLTKQLKSLQAAKKNNANTVLVFIQEFQSLMTVYEEHALHEDKVVFPAVRRFFPGLNPSMDEEHVSSSVQVKLMKDAAYEYQQSVGLDGNFDDDDESSPRDALANLLKVFGEVLPAWEKETLEHLLNEEGTVTVAARKHLSVEAQVGIVKEVYEETPAEKWAVIFPFVVKSMPHIQWKVRYVQCFLWASPHRAEEIGLALFRGCDDVTWQFISQQLPELIPRGLSGYRRIY